MASIKTMDLSMAPSPSYFDADYEFSELEVVGRVFLTTLAPVILEVGSGAGAALFPLLSSLPPTTRAVAIDIAPTAIDLLRSQPKFDESLIAAHVCDICILFLPLL
ncbi:hypothetical protein TrRE_jg10151 [Triparma retinervis]|uniref:Uncharacterized protein n=1 Tax=Triparma retinervis TaxID=2557542 RepID=A0A9W7E2I9_9STRA|nr:hypothetical protein TrRE_jg10151 [Triparma retinervis]